MRSVSPVTCGLSGREECIKKTVGLRSLCVTLTHGQWARTVQKHSPSLVGMDLSVVSALATGLDDALHRLLGNEVFPWPPLSCKDKNHGGNISHGILSLFTTTLIPPPLCFRW